MSAPTEAGATCPQCGDVSLWGAARCRNCRAPLDARSQRPRRARVYVARSCPYCGTRTYRRWTCRGCKDLPALDPGHPLYKVSA